MKINKSLIRKGLIFFLPFVLASAHSGEEYVPVKLATVVDFKVESELARQAKAPMLVLISQEHCGFCVQIKEQILGPMILSGDYKKTLLIRELFIDYGSRVRDFSGVEIDSGEFALRYKAYLTPTLLFIGPDGEELTERMVGFQTPELYFFYVESAVENAIAALRKQG